MKAKFISYFLFMLTMSFFAACSDDDNTIPEPTPDPAPEETANTYTYKDKVVEAKSVICTDYFKGYYCIYMSPLMNLATVEDFIGSGREYVTFMIPETSASKEVSLMDETNECTLYYMDENSEPILASHDEDTWENVSDGKINIILGNKTESGVYAVTAKFNVTFKDGKSFTGIATSTYTPPTPLSNQIACGDEIKDIKSAYAMMFQGNQFIYLSPVENLTNADEITNTEDYMYIGFNPNMIGQEIDITTEETKYTIGHMLEWQNKNILEKEIAIAPGTWDEYCQNGTIQIESLGNSKVKLSFDITLTSGKSFRGAYEGPCTIDEYKPSTTNILTINDVTQDIKSTFFLKQEGVTGLYLTPSNISSLDYINDVSTYYVYVAAPDNALNGSKINLTTAEDMSVMYYNPSSEEMIYNEDGSGTGTYSIKAGSAEDEYEITINVEIDGMTISGNYKGKFKTDAPAVKENEYYLTDGTPVSINSVLIDKKSNETMCDIYLAGGSGLNTVDAIKAADPIIIRMPESALNDDLQSFSGNHSLSITYKSTLYNYESSQSDLIDGGNASVTLDGDNSIIEFKLFNIRNYEGQGLTGYYNGTVTIIE